MGPAGKPIGPGFNEAEPITNTFAEPVTPVNPVCALDPVIVNPLPNVRYASLEVLPNISATSKRVWQAELPGAPMCAVTTSVVVELAVVTN
jgi:hypothetical protein